MKIRKFKMITIFSAMLFGFVVTPSVLAQVGSSSASSVVVQDVSGTTLSKLYSNVVAKLYNKFLHLYAAMAYEIDPQLPTIVTNNAAMKSSKSNMTTAMSQSSQNVVQASFQGIAAKNNAAYNLQQISAGDDVIDVSGSGASSIIKNIFSSGASTLSIKQQNQIAEKNSVMFNIDSLLGPGSYSKLEQTNANAFLNEINSIAQPTVIRLAPTFKVPKSSGIGGASGTTMTIGDKNPLSADDLVRMQQTLQTKPAYRKYRAAYRQTIAQRSIFINSLLALYQERVPQKGSGKSAYEIRNSVVAQRLSPSYYQAMSKASPATVSRETLFLLAQISSQLNAIQNQNDRVIAMDAIDGMHTLGATAQLMSPESQQVGQIVYCAVPANKDEDQCKQAAAK